MSAPLLVPALALVRKLERREEPRPITYHPVRLAKSKVLAEAEAVPQLQYERPKYRHECFEGQNAARPCPWVSCAHHLYIDVKDTGAYTVNFPHLEVHELPYSCSLDIADDGEHTLEAVARALNVTRERARQLIVRVQRKLRLRAKWGEDGDFYALDKKQATPKPEHVKRARLYGSRSVGERKRPPRPPTLRRVRRRAVELAAHIKQTHEFMKTTGIDAPDRLLAQPIKLLMVMGAQLERRWSFVDLVLAAWKMYPSVFSLPGHPEHPHSQAVATVMSKVRAKGWASGNNAGFFLTAKGQEEAASYKLAWSTLDMRPDAL